MSDIPRAREYLRHALLTLKGTIEGNLITHALDLMTRGQPATERVKAND